MILHILHSAQSLQPRCCRDYTGAFDWNFPEWLLQFSSVQSLSCVQFFVTPWTVACQASLSITNSQSLLKIISIKSVMPSNHLILCCPILLLSSIFPCIRVFSNESVLHYLHHSLGTGREHSPTHQQKIRLKIYGALPIKTRPSSPHSQSLQSGSFHKPLSLFIRGQTE